jgi:hypothetical protein
MPMFRKIACAALLAATMCAAFAPAARADEPQQMGFVRGTDYYKFQMDQYREAIAKMPAADRTRLMAMQDKIMQMEMDLAKARRDMEFFILSSAFPTQNPNH